MAGSDCNNFLVFANILDMKIERAFFLLLIRFFRYFTPLFAYFYAKNVATKVLDLFNAEGGFVTPTNTYNCR